jgi:GNAT superfamily N-acetyltransferase
VIALPEEAHDAVAVGWATVELDRAAVELAHLLVDGSGFDAAPSSAILGARCRVGPAAAEAGLRIVLLEPETEGLLAAALARFGEGWAAIWVPDRASGTIDVAKRDVPAVSKALSAARPGPFGPERLSTRGAPAGPRRLVVGAVTIAMTMTEAAPTIRPASATDAETIAALFTDEGYPAGPSDIVERLTRFASDHSRVLVAEHEGELLGFIALHALPRFEHDDRILRVLALVVDAGARERGVGHALMAEAERIGAELGAAFIEITAGHHRADARRLYESLGYDGSVAAYLRKKL